MKSEVILLFIYQKNVFEFGESIQAYEIAVTDSLENHTHDFIEIVYMLQGEVWHTINGQKLFFKEGDYVIIDFNTIHSFDIIGKNPIRVINCLFTPDLIDQALQGCRSIKQLLNHYLITFDCMIENNKPLNFHDDDCDILDLLKNIENEYANKDHGYVQIIRSNLVEAIIKTMRKYVTKNNSKDVNYKSDENLHFLKKYIESNYAKTISLKSLADELNLSTNYISHYFKKCTGITFSSYIQKARISNACRLLTNTNYRVGEISTMVGYNDCKFFTEIFKKAMTASPLQYRKMNRDKV